MSSLGHWLQDLRRTFEAAPKPGETLGIYAHVPFCKHACPYCDFYKLELRDRPARSRLEFPGLLAMEIALLKAQWPTLAEWPLETIYFGGGTPSALSPGSVGELIGSLKAFFLQFAGIPPEVTLEANPENLTAPRARAWWNAGVNRLSIGVQSFHPRDLQRLERLHGPDTIVRAVQNSRAAGFTNLSLDLMFALPEQTVEEWLDNLHRALALEPEHLSFYGLTIHERTPFEVLAKAGKLTLPDDDIQAEMYLRGAELLESAGFEHYEISNFARPGFRSRHNQRYWTGAPVLGLGPGAHSHGRQWHWSNPEDLEGWAESVRAGQIPWQGHEQDRPGQAQEIALFTGLRRAEGISAAEHPALHAALRRWLQKPENACWRPCFREGTSALALTKEGWLLSDAIILAAANEIRWSK